MFFIANSFSLKLFLIIFFKIYNISLDSDPNWAKILHPDPNSMHLDPQHWLLVTAGPEMCHSSSQQLLSRKGSHVFFFFFWGGGTCVEEDVINPLVTRQHISAVIKKKHTILLFFCLSHYGITLTSLRSAKHFFLSQTPWIRLEQQLWVWE